MKKGYLAKLLSIALSVVVTSTSAIPSYAMGSTETFTEELSEVAGDNTGEDDPVDELLEDTTIGNEDAEDSEETTGAEAEAGEEPDEDIADEGLTDEDMADEDAVDEAGEEQFNVTLASEIEELEEDPQLMSHDDAVITFESLGAVSTTRGIFTLLGDVAEQVDEKLVTPCLYFDSIRDFSFYIVPAMGYDWGAGNITLSGGYKAVEEESAYSIVEDADYTIEDSDVSVVETEIKDGENTYYSYDEYDWDAAKKITIIRGSKISKALAKRDVESLWDVEPTLSATVAEAVPQRVQLYNAYEDSLSAPSPSIDMTSDTYRPIYDSAYSRDLSALISASDKTKKVAAKVSLVSADETTEIPYAYDASASSSEAAQYSYNAGTLTVNQVGINKAYLMAKQGYRLTVTFYELAEETVSLAPARTDYVTFAKTDNTAFASATRITTAGINVPKNKNYYFYAGLKSGNDPTRSLLGILANDAVAPSYLSSASVKIDGYGNSVGSNETGYADATGTVVSEGVYYLPASELQEAAALKAVTSEQVTINGGFEGSALVTFKVGEVSKTITGSSTVLSPGTGAGQSGAITGEDYTFEVRPVEGKKVSSITVKMYNAKGDEFSTYSEALGNLVVEDYGVYTVPGITERLVINVTVVPESSDCDVSVENNTDVKFYRLSDKKEITTTATALAGDGETFKFKAVPVQGKAITSLSYKVGNGEFTTLTGTLDGAGGTNYSLSVTGDTVLKAETETGYTFTKIANPHAKVTVNGITIKDGCSLGGVPAGTGITVSVTGADADVAVEGVWYPFTELSPEYD